MCPDLVGHDVLSTRYRVGACFSAKGSGWPLGPGNESKKQLTYSLGSQGTPPKKVRFASGPKDECQTFVSLFLHHWDPLEKREPSRTVLHVTPWVLFAAPSGAWQLWAWPTCSRFLCTASAGEKAGACHLCLKL